MHRGNASTYKRRSVLSAKRIEDLTIRRRRMSQYCHRVLPDGYKQELAEMTVFEVAAESARFRSSSHCRKGSATAAILYWYRMTYGRKAYEAFLLIYRSYGAAEKAARGAGMRQRPERRPIVGARARARLSFV
jgi:hypothetical protein